MNCFLNISDARSSSLTVTFETELSALQIKAIVYFMILSSGEKFAFSFEDFNKTVAHVHFLNMPILKIIKQLESKYQVKALFHADSLATELCLTHFKESMPQIEIGFKK